MCYITVKKSLEHKQECMYCNQTVQCMGLFHAAPSKTNARNKTLDALMNNTSVVVWCVYCVFGSTYDKMCSSSLYFTVGSNLNLKKMKFINGSHNI